MKELNVKQIYDLICEAQQPLLEEYEGETGGECYDSGYYNGRTEAIRHMLDMLGISYLEPTSEPVHSLDPEWPACDCNLPVGTFWHKPNCAAVPK